MPLDLVVLGANGRPQKSVSIGVEQHTRLMRLAKKLRARVLLRLEDYYNDVVFSGLSTLQCSLRKVRISK